MKYSPITCVLCVYLWLKFVSINSNCFCARASCTMLYILKININPFCRFRGKITMCTDFLGCCTMGTHPNDAIAPVLYVCFCFMPIDMNWKTVCDKCLGKLLISSSNVKQEYVSNSNCELIRNHVKMSIRAVDFFFVFFIGFCLFVIVVAIFRFNRLPLIIIWLTKYIVIGYYYYKLYVAKHLFYAYIWRKITSN